MTERRHLKLRRLGPDHLVRMFPLDGELYEIQESDRIGVYKTHVVEAPTRRKARFAFEAWLNTKYPRTDK